MNYREAVATFRGHRVPHFRIIQNRRWWFMVSGAVIVLSVLGLGVRGLNMSIDFEGGSQITLEDRRGVSVDEVRSLLAGPPYNLGESEVQLVGGNQISIRTRSLTELTTSERTQLIRALARSAGVSVDDVSVKVVGPTWGGEISRKAVQGLIVVLVAITAYITFRFEWKMAIGAIIALVHDVVITAGVYALVGREVTPATVIAILTILGFSLYDTVVIYDKIKENTESPVMLAKDTYAGVVNTSLNQVLMRSVNTSLVVVFPILSLLLFGGDTLKDFAFAMLIGTITGAYSSIFVASPILAVLKEREPKYAQIHARTSAREATRPLRAVPEREALAVEPEEADQEAVPTPVGAAAATRAAARSGAPRSGQSRPHAKGKRKAPAKRRRR
ncbi:MAG: protein translocase subunit SecF [Actinomycetota bacterium]